jgi:hypothetical protein
VEEQLFLLIVLHSLILLSAIGVMAATTCTKFRSSETLLKDKISGQVQHESISVFGFHIWLRKRCLLTQAHY